MALELKKYAKYGLDKFTVSIEIETTLGNERFFTVTTSPIMDQEVIDDVQKILPDALHEDADEASFSIDSSGSIQSRGILESSEAVLLFITQKGRDQFFSRLESMENDENLEIYAQHFAKSIIRGGFVKDQIQLKVVCPEHGIFDRRLLLTFFLPYAKSFNSHQTIPYVVSNDRISHPFFPAVGQGRSQRLSRRT